MTLDRLGELACRHFNISKETLGGSGRATDDISMARHIFRTTATEIYNISQWTIVKEGYGNERSNISNSRKVILEYKQYEREYEEFKSFVELNGSIGVQISKDPSGIERVTNEAYDERFYRHPKRLNPRTNQPYFPAFHFLTSLGAPEPIGLSKWRQTMGHFADHVMVRSQLIGSYVHDSIDRMIKSDSIVSHEDIHRSFPDAKEAQKIKNCFLGFINFIAEEEPIILATERMECGQDFGFTLDSKMKLKSDNYKNVWVVDWKTSKVANEDHKMQLEAMRRVAKCDKALVVVLGNTTKKKYTATPVKPSEQDHLWNRFQAIKETAYVEILKRGSIKPREDNMPSVFSMKGLKFKRKL
jgi:hypothetical protein